MYLFKNSVGYACVHEYVEVVDDGREFDDIFLLALNP